MSTALLFITRTFAPDLTLENVKDPTYTQMVAAAQAETDPTARLEAYKRLNAYMIDQAFVIPVGSRPYVYAIRPGVTGFQTGPLGMAITTGVSVSN